MPESRSSETPSSANSPTSHSNSFCPSFVQDSVYESPLLFHLCALLENRLRTIEFLINFKWGPAGVVGPPGSKGRLGAVGQQGPRVEIPENRYLIVLCTL